MDELSNMESGSLSDFAYEVSQGKGKDKGTATANANRKNDTTWRNITLSSSNSSFYQKLFPNYPGMRLVYRVLLAFCHFLYPLD